MKLRLIILLSLLIALSFANTIQSPLERDAELFMNRRRLEWSDTNYSINGSCTDNETKCNKLIDGVCKFWTLFGDSCFSSYMVFGFGISVFIMIPFLCLGCYCMNDVTTPLRVPTRILPVRKEY